MNRVQRKQLSRLQDQVTTIRDEVDEIHQSLPDDDDKVTMLNVESVAGTLKMYADSLADIQQDVAEMRSEEEEKLDNMPDSLRDGEKGQTLEEIIGYLEDCDEQFDMVISWFKKPERLLQVEADDMLQNATGALEEIIDHIDNAASA